MLHKLLLHLQSDDFGDATIHHAVWAIIATATSPSVPSFVTDSILALLLPHFSLLLDFAQHPPASVEDHTNAYIANMVIDSTLAMPDSYTSSYP